MTMKAIELLAPAKDYACGKAAVDHGADAVYIGGPAFGARAAAGNTLADIARLADYGHRYRAKVYMTLNTILFDHELEDAQDLARQAWDAGVDALIIQDMGLLELDLPPVPLIASTQMHNHELSHIRFLEEVGFQRVILARELSLEEIRAIREHTSIELEAFVYGALCVSYSGRCYLSYTLGGRSANRGTCGQPCRLPWDLVDAQGKKILADRYALSLKDLDRCAYLAEMIDAGVTAFKIEGRLKDIAYVKNITALYRQHLDALIEGRPDLKRASSGTTTVSFTPEAAKTFSRGSTAYFLRDQDDDIWSPDTSKSIGEVIGKVKKSSQNWFTLSEAHDTINAGDGLCYFDGQRELKGLQVVKVVEGRVQVHTPPADLKPGTTVYRNHDHRFLKQLEAASAERTLGVHMTLCETPDGFELKALDEDGIEAVVRHNTPKRAAEKPEQALETIRKQLSRLGESMFHLARLDMKTPAYFLRTSELNRMRRDLITALEENRRMTYKWIKRAPEPQPPARYPVVDLDASYNVSNEAARTFYRRHGVQTISECFDLHTPVSGEVVMTTRHCLRRCLRACPREASPVPLALPLAIVYAQRRFRLHFDCRLCRMLVLLD